MSSSLISKILYFGRYGCVRPIPHAVITDSHRNEGVRMKPVMAGMVLLAAVIFALVFFRQEDPVELAVEAEKQGDTTQACEYYTKALLQATPSFEYPGEGRAGVLNRESYRKRIKEYIRWTAESPSGTNQTAFQAIAGIARCSTAVENQHLLIIDTIALLDSSSYLHRFRRAFYSTIHDSSAVETQAAEGMNNKLSILRIRSPRDFAYYGSLLDPNTYRRTEFTLFPESTIDLLVRPGGQALILQSEVTFQGGQVWRSPRNVLWIDVPEEPSGLGLALKTRVRRK